MQSVKTEERGGSTKSLEHANSVVGGICDQNVVAAVYTHAHRLVEFGLQRRACNRNRSQSGGEKDKRDVGGGTEGQVTPSACPFSPEPARVVRVLLSAESMRIRQLSESDSTTQQHNTTQQRTALQSRARRQSAHSKAGGLTTNDEVAGAIERYGCGCVELSGGQSRAVTKARRTGSGDCAHHTCVCVWVSD